MNASSDARVKIDYIVAQYLTKQTAAKWLADPEVPGLSQVMI